MQYFVLIYDLLVLVYYIYQMPIWDCIKNKFPFFQYEAKTAEKADCTNLLLTIMFNCISKVSRLKESTPSDLSNFCTSFCFQGLAIVIIMVTASLANSNIDQISDDYSYDESNKDAIDSLKDAQGPLKMSMIFNGILAGCMLLNFVLGGFTLGKPLRQHKSAVDAE